MKDIDKIKELLKNKEVTFQKTTFEKKQLGECDFENKIISIKKNVGEGVMMSILIHECLHFIYPRRGEKWVLKREGEVFGALNKRQYRTFLCFLNKM